MIDPFVGKVGAFRVHQGTVTPGLPAFHRRGKKAFKVGHAYLLQGKDFIETDALRARRHRGSRQGRGNSRSTPCSHDSHEEDHIHLMPLEFPTPMHALAIEPKRRGDEQKTLRSAAQARGRGSHAFKIEHNATINETIIRGLGDLHMRYILDAWRASTTSRSTTKPPRIPYRETITAKAEGHHRHKKQTGGAGQFGEVFLEVEPLRARRGLRVRRPGEGRRHPARSSFPRWKRACAQVLETGPVAGYPVQDVRVIVYDGKHHDVDSKEVAFVAAGKRAFMDAIGKARPIILEPIVNIEITAPEQNMGDIAGDLSSKRGQLSGTDASAPGTLLIKGQVPLSELANYQARLKSVTAGQGSFTVEFSRYDPVPPNVQKNLAEQHAKTAVHAEEQ